MPSSTIIFPREKPEVLTDKVYTISMQLCSMKHEHHQCTNLGQLKILSNPFLPPRMLIILKSIIFPFQGCPIGWLHPLCKYTTHIHLNDIVNINIISSQCRQHHPISISSLTSTSSHLNIIMNIKIISSQYYHQLHLISISTSPHFNIINITSNHIPHTYTYKLMCEIRISQVFRQHKSYNNNS